MPAFVRFAALTGFGPRQPPGRADTVTGSPSRRRHRETSESEGSPAATAAPRRPRASLAGCAPGRALCHATSRRTPARASRNRLVPSGSPTYDHFAQLVTRQEELQRLESGEQLLQIPIIENLLRLVHAAIGHQQRLRILDTERILRRRRRFFLRLKHRQQ